jgi:hypothetical protein
MNRKGRPLTEDKVAIVCPVTFLNQLYLLTFIDNLMPASPLEIRETIGREDVHVQGLMTIESAWKNKCE